MGKKEQLDLQKRVGKLESEVKLLKEQIGKLNAEKPSKIKEALEIAVSVAELIGAILAIVLLLAQ